MEPKQHDDPAFNLWTFLVETEAVLRDLDISHVPECVWQAYYDRDMSPPEALSTASAFTRTSRMRHGAE